MLATIREATLFDVPLAFVWVAFLIELTPGPNMTYLAVLSLVEGRRAGFLTVAGIASGLLFVGVLAAFGVAAFVSGSPFLYELLRWLGVLYMGWLAYDIWRGHEASDADEASTASTSGTHFVRGFLTNILNPKAAVFYVAVLPEFVNSELPILRQTLGLSIAYTLIATIVHAAIVALASRMRPLLQDAHRMQIVRRVLAIALLFVAIWLLFSAAPTND